MKPRLSCQLCRSSSAFSTCPSRSAQMWSSKSSISMRPAQDLQRDFAGVWICKPASLMMAICLARFSRACVVVPNAPSSFKAVIMCWLKLSSLVLCCPDCKTSSEWEKQNLPIEEGVQDFCFHTTKDVPESSKTVEDNQASPSKRPYVSSNMKSGDFVANNINKWVRTIGGQKNKLDSRVEGPYLMADFTDDTHRMVIVADANGLGIEDTAIIKFLQGLHNLSAVGDQLQHLLRETEGTSQAQQRCFMAP
ncbi:TPA: hypothetical protein ACH3X2_002502 [Trebouxia sp. C0005]